MANEKRLIDANALLAELDKFANPMPNKSGYDFLCGVASVITEVECAPTVDAVEVVRCKYCIKRYDTDECPMCFVSDGKYYEFTQDDGFCDRGERKEE